MADKTDKCSKNITGKYYVDNSCIGCGLCYQTAPEFFEQDEVDGKAYIFLQPGTAQEMISCEEMLQECPVNAIGNDG